MPLVVSCTVTSSGRPSSAPSTCSWVTGSSLPTSGHSCSVRRSSTVGVEEIVGFLAQRGRVDGHGGHGRHGPWTRDPGAGDELVDVVDEHDRVVATVTRRRMRAERLRHRAVFIVVASSAGRLLVHRRSDGKDLWPGRWDVAVGGVVGAGEAYDDAARRELAEELGIDAPRRCRSAPARYADDDVDLVARCYRVVHDGPFRFADGEVVEARWVDAAGLAALLATARVRARQPGAAAAGGPFPFRAPVNTHDR